MTLLNNMLKVPASFECPVFEEDLAEEFQVTPETVNEWFFIQDGPPHVMFCGHRHYLVSQVKSWLIKNDIQF
ncbi:hypothetical protein [Terasakiella sp.]|uniref:hypothetical protein n=1 Tax=Terasakiella sp. TaxID=2034861 RepID=UPI003AA7EBB3